MDFWCHFYSFLGKSPIIIYRSTLICIVINNPLLHSIKGKDLTLEIRKIDKTLMHFLNHVKILLPKSLISIIYLEKNLLYFISSLLLFFSLLEIIFRTFGQNRMLEIERVKSFSSNCVYKGSLSKSTKILV